MQLHDVTHALINLQQPLADSKRVHLATTLQDDLPTVWADPDLIERVFQNLISNALKFTPEGGEVHITARYSPENAGKVYISINDTGPGIPSEIRERLFEKFTTGQQQERGTGLGLTFCKMALVAHGEDIWVEHTSRRGTTFTFTLPIAPAAHPSEV